MEGVVNNNMQKFILFTLASLGEQILTDLINELGLKLSIVVEEITI